VGRQPPDPGSNSNSNASRAEEDTPGLDDPESTGLLFRARTMASGGGVGVGFGDTVTLASLVAVPQTDDGSEVSPRSGANRTER
jgi:hypothetical protein